MPKKKSSWKEEAWERLLSQYWDGRTNGDDSIEYTKEQLHPILRKYTKSGQGEIRIFHSGSNRLEALKRRGLVKVPISRTQWKLVKRSPQIKFEEPEEECVFTPINPLTSGMKAGIVETMNQKTNPGETTLLAIANHTGVIADFYNLKKSGVLFTGGRQKAGIKLVVNGNEVDMSKAQIEIDGGFEWASEAVIAEVKSSFSQPDFDVNQALIPTLKWQKLLPDKKVHSMVLLAGTSPHGIEYWVYDLDIQMKKGQNNMKVLKSKKYKLKVKS